MCNHCGCRDAEEFAENETFEANLIGDIDNNMFFDELYNINLEQESDEGVVWVKVQKLVEGVGPKINRDAMISVLGWFGTSTEAEQDAKRELKILRERYTDGVPYNPTLSQSYRDNTSGYSVMYESDKERYGRMRQFPRRIKSFRVHGGDTIKGIYWSYYYIPTNFIGGEIMNRFDEIVRRRAEEFGAENANKIHVLLKEQAVDNQDGKYDGEESFEMHISQSQEELRNKVKEYLNDLVSEGIDDYIEYFLKTSPSFMGVGYGELKTQIKAQINSPETSISELCDLLNEMGEALENSRGDYGARYSYYTPRDTVLRVSGINPDPMYMAEEFGAENQERVIDESLINLESLMTFMAFEDPTGLSEVRQAIEHMNCDRDTVRWAIRWWESSYGGVPEETLNYLGLDEMWKRPFGAEGYDEIEVERYVDVDINWKTDPHPHPNEDDIDGGEIFDEVEGLVEREVERGSDSGYGDTEFEIDVEDDLDGEITQETVKVEYDYDLQAESFEAKGIDTFSQPFEELNPLGAIGKLMVFAGSVNAGTAIGKKLGGQ